MRFTCYRRGGNEWFVRLCAHSSVKFVHIEPRAVLTLTSRVGVPRLVVQVEAFRPITHYGRYVTTGYIVCSHESNMQVAQRRRSM